MSGGPGSGYAFGGRKVEAMKRRLRAVQAAMDRGYGHRCITHDRTNPFDATERPLEHDAWESGWCKAERELRAGAR